MLKETSNKASFDFEYTYVSCVRTLSIIQICRSVKTRYFNVNNKTQKTKIWRKHSSPCGQNSVIKWQGFKPIKAIR